MEQIEVPRTLPIGDCSEAAEQSLHRREQWMTSLKRLSIRSMKQEDGSGANRGDPAMAVMEPSETEEVSWKARPVTYEAKKYFETCYRRYGPRQIKSDSISLPAFLFYS